MRRLLQRIKVFTIITVILVLGSGVNAQRQMEKLNRGVVAVRTNSNQVFISWRLFGSDQASTAFNLYRGTTKVNSIPIDGATNYTDNTTVDSIYTVRAIVNGIEQPPSGFSKVWHQFYKEIPLKVPSGGATPDGIAYTYSANDCSVGDLDGDGEYEIVLKWDPSNSKDNSQSGYTGDVFLDAYKLDGTFLWRIDLGKNIRAGAHYTQFMVYDLDGDGKAEVACKTAPGTIDGKGNYLTGAAAGTDNYADYRNSKGYILSGPEYLTVFKGQTGAELTTVNYDPPRGSVSSWGDSYGNRVDRFLACVAYLDGIHPSLVMCRGYYTRAYLAAYDFHGGTLTERWTFDSNTSGNSGYAGQGCHSLCVGDVDGDGCDEIVYGACTIDHNGKGLYTTGLGHGDALHLGVFDPSLPGYQVWQAHEDCSTNGNVGGSFRDAKTGKVIWYYPGTTDQGRGMAADLDTTKGIECWVGSSGLYSCKGALLNSSKPASDNFGIWWDGDDQRELLDGTRLDKYRVGRLVTFSDYETATACNSTKNTPNLQADILGDWREEVILHSADNTKLLIYTTTTPTTRRLYTLMHDPVYRLGIAWQNVAYNQPPDVSFYLGKGMTTPPFPSMYYPDYKLAQSISMDALPNKSTSDTAFLLSATASSGLAVSYTSSKTSVATVSGKVVRIIGPGTTTITASQAGNDEYTPASSVQQTLTVTTTATGLESLSPKEIRIYPNPVKKCLYVYLPDTRQKSVITVNSLDGKTMCVNKSDIRLNEIDMGKYASGTYIVKVEASDGACTKKILKL